MALHPQPTQGPEATWSALGAGGEEGPGHAAMASGKSPNLFSHLRKGWEGSKR